MKRLATDNVLEMDMVQLALNQVYIRGGWAQYRNGLVDDLSACDLIRAASIAMGGTCGYEKNNLL